MVERDKRTWLTIRPHWLVGLAGTLCVAMLSGSAEAGDPEEDRKKAEMLFNDGRAAVKANDYATACPKFEQSLKLARRAGTLFNLAQCEEHEGRLVTAVQYYKEGIVVLEPGDPRLAPSKKQLAIIEPRLPYLTVTFIGFLPAGGRVTLDGREVDALDKEFAVNPGKHTLRVLAPKYETSVVEFEMAEAAHETKTVSAGARLPEPPPPSVSAFGPQRIAALAAFGVGGLGVVGAVITGGLLVSTKSRMDEGCPGTVCATAAGFEASRSGKPLLVANTIAWGLGIAGAGAGTFLLLYKGKKNANNTQSAHSFLLSPGFVGIEGSF